MSYRPFARWIALSCILALAVPLVCSMAFPRTDANARIRRVGELNTD